MNQIKLKIEEIGLSQREISVRLGKNPSYLAGVFRSGLSTSKQAELMADLEVVVGGGTVQSYNQIIAELSQKLTRTEDKYLETHKIKERQAFKIDDQDKIIAQLDLTVAKLQAANSELRDESDKYFNDLNETQKHLLESNQEIEQIESKYRYVLIFNYVLSLVILGIAISWVLA